MGHGLPAKRVAQVLYGLPLRLHRRAAAVEAVGHRRLVVPDDVRSYALGHLGVLQERGHGLPDAVEHVPFAVARAGLEPAEALPKCPAAVPELVRLLASDQERITVAALRDLHLPSALRSAVCGGLPSR